jgi:protein-S-isoprenylcysteine O-methyltransferase Ste14
VHPEAARRAHPAVRTLYGLVHHLSEDVGGGPRPVKLAWVINFQKGLTWAVVLGLMAAYDDFSTTAWVYLGLHGTYGLCWLMKHLAFPDASWERRATLGGALMSFLLVLGPYWLLPWLLVSRGLEAPGPLLAAAISLHTLGVAVMLAADAQKHFALKRGGGLITDGMFARTRHPNYLGEMTIYASYALLVQHWLAWAILAWVWSAVFLPNILMQEASLSRHPGWAEYRARTGLVLPRLGLSPRRVR